MISSVVRYQVEMILEKIGKAVLENLAVSPCGLTKNIWGYAGSPMKGANEVGEVCEACIEGHRRNRTVILGQEASGTAQPRAHQILVWCDTQHVAEQSQKVKWAQPRFTCCRFEIDGLLGMRVNP